MIPLAYIDNVCELAMKLIFWPTHFGLKQDRTDMGNVHHVIMIKLMLIQ